MSTRTVTTQSELDAALTEQVEQIIIDSPRGVWIRLVASGSASVVAYGSASVRASGSASVVASGSASVRAYDSASVVAYDSASVVAYGSASVRASGSASVVAYDSASVRAYDSASVEAYDSASVRAYDSASVRASGSASVVASGSASVRAYDSASVEAYDSASVRAYDSASVEAYDSASVEASKFVAVHLRSASVKLTGGIVIDLTQLDMTDLQTWLDYHGIKVRDGKAILIKAVDAQLVAGHDWNPTTYTVGDDITCPDWQPTASCGNGLHFTYTPARGAQYLGARAQRPFRYLEVAVPLDGLIVVGDDKVKSATCTVLREIDEHGREIQPAVES